jgi:predicted PhzF superfamily epimerase YddE/YHI9
MALSFTTLDVFTETSFKGNPVAIVQVPSDAHLSQNQKQRIAQEFNLSETVFLHEQTAADVASREARIDIFTSIAEVPFAGHPTIGTSNFIVDHLKLTSVDALVAKAGRLPFSRHGKGVQLAVAHDVHVHSGPFANTDFGHFPVVSIVKGMTFILAKQPDLEALGKPTTSYIGTDRTYQVQDRLDEGWQTGLVASYLFFDQGIDSEGTRQLRTRCLGSREDPATGSAASALSSYITLQEGIEGPLTRRYQVTQGVEMGRRSEIHVQVTLEESRDKIKEVLIGGVAVQTVEGKINIPSE